MPPIPPRHLRTCLLLAAAVAGLGLSLRLAVPVAPVDAAFRDVLRAYGSAPGGAPSNTGETSPPQ